MTNLLSSSHDKNWKRRNYLIGGITGLAVGLLSAYFYARAAEEHGDIEPSKIKTMDALRLAVALLAIVRQITDLGTRD